MITALLTLLALAVLVPWVCVAFGRRRRTGTVYAYWCEDSEDSTGPDDGTC